MTTIHTPDATELERIAKACAEASIGDGPWTAAHEAAAAETLGFLESASCARFEGYISDGPGYAGPVTVIVWPGGPELVSVVTEAPAGRMCVQHLQTPSNPQTAVASLIQQYGPRRSNQWGEHPDFPRSDWKYEVANDDTNLGYWEWLANRLDEAR